MNPLIEESADTVSTVRDELSAAGWNLDDFSVDDPMSPRLRMSQDDNEVTVSAVPENRSTSTDRVPLRIHYCAFQSQADVRQAVESVLTAEHPDFALLASMRRRCSKEQQQRANDLLDEHPVQTAAIWLAFAQQWLGEGQQDLARKAVLYAHFLQHIDGEPGRNMTLEQMTRILRIPAAEYEQIDSEMLKTLRIPVLNADSSATAKGTVRLGQPSAIQVIDSKGESTVLGYVIRQAAGPNSYLVIQSEYGRTRSWSSSTVSDPGRTATVNTVGDLKLSMTGQVLENGLVEITVEMTAVDSPDQD